MEFVEESGGWMIFERNSVLFTDKMKEKVFVKSQGKNVFLLKLNRIKKHGKSTPLEKKKLRLFNIT